MSTKTSIKRIALVAAAALTLGGFTAVSASAGIVDTGTTPSWAATAGTVYSGGGTSSATQIVGNTATVVFSETVTSSAATEIFANFTVAGVGSVTTYPTAVATSTPINVGVAGSSVIPTGSLAAPYGSTAAGYDVFNTAVSGGAPLSLNGALVKTTFVLYSAAAGTQTVTAIAANGVAYTATVTWVASTSVGISASKSMIYAVPATTACAAVGTNHASDLANVTNAGTSITSALKTDSVAVCYITRDANDNLVSVTATGPVFSGLGLSTTTSGGGSSGKATLGANTVSGATTITAILTDVYGTTITMTLPFTYYGSMATIALANYSYAAAYGGDHAGASAPLVATTTSKVGASTSALGVIQVIAKDSAGALIDARNGGNLTSAQITVVSDANPSVAVTAGSASSNSAGASVAIGSDANSDTYAAGWTGGELAVDCAASTKAEKLTITLSALNSSGVRVISAPVTFYCSASAKTVAVTAASSSVDAGATTTLTATVADKYGYPAPDGTAVTFASTGQGVVAPASGSTWNGVAGTTDTNLVNFIAAGDGGSATVTAIAGNYSGTTSISVAGGSGSSSLSLDAANAATDAANNAYDEAQNATQAASDALAAVTALSAQVSALIATVKSLAAMVAKIKAKVKA